MSVEAVRRPRSHAAPEVSPDATLARLFIEAAVSHSESIALLGSEGVLRYGDLLLWAQNVAVALRRAGLRPGELVGVADWRSMASVAGLVGTILAGGVCVPLSPGSGEERLRQMALASGSRFLLEDGEAADGQPLKMPPGVRTLDLSRVEREIIPSFAETRLPQTVPESPAAVLFDEQMHGVLVTDRGIVRTACNRSLWQLAPRDVVLQHTSWAEHPSLLELWGGLLHGCRVVIAPHERLSGDPTLSLRRFGEWLRRCSVSCLTLSVEEFCVLAEVSPDILASVRQIVVGCPLPDRERLLAAVAAVWGIAPHLAIVYACGAPETTGFAITWRLERDALGNPVLEPGAPVEGASAWIVDSNGREASEEKPGRIAIGGEVLALGYLGEPARTCGRFLPRPGGDGSLQERMYVLKAWTRRLPGGGLVLARDPVSPFPASSAEDRKGPARADEAAPSRGLWQRLLRIG